MRRFAGIAALLAVPVSTWLILALVTPAVASAAERTETRSIPIDPVTSLEIHSTANCVPNDQCYFTTRANLLRPEGPIGFPDGFWARQNTTLRSMDRDTYMESDFNAPNTREFKSISDNEFSTVYFGGGPPEKFTVNGNTKTLDWSTGQLKQDGDYIVCSYIQVVYPGVNLTSPTACARTTY